MQAKESNTSHKRQSEPAPKFGMLDAAGLFTRGMAMGVADVIPGVSGGTIALISGIYERFIGALRSLSLRFVRPLVKGNLGEARAQVMRMHWAVLVPLFAGIGLAILSMSKLVTGLMEDEPGPTYALFFGLILASSWMPLARAKTRSWRMWAALGIAVVSAWVFVGMRGGEVALENVDWPQRSRVLHITYAGEIHSTDDLDAIMNWYSGIAIELPPEDFLDQLAPNDSRIRFVVFDPNGIVAQSGDPRYDEFQVFADEKQLVDFLADDPGLIVLDDKRAQLSFIFVCGMVAISAMILPGLSGSFLLLFLGQYHAVFTTAHRLVSRAMAQVGRELDPMIALSGRSAWDDVLFMGVFGVGLLIGLVVFSRVVGWLLDHAHDVTMATLTGVMVGALRQPGLVVWESRPDGDAGSYWPVAIGVALLGAAVVLGLHFADQAMQKRRAGPHGTQER